MPSATPVIAYSPVACAHERGPGTSVCLRCRAEAHAAAAARVRRILIRVSAVVVVVVVVAGIGGGAITAHNGVSRQGGTSESFAATATVVAQGQPAVAAASQAAAPPPTSLPAPVIDAGRTELTDGMYAERNGGVVTVHFDTELARTRRRDKFENVVRQTLPAVFGERADSILAATPMGEVARGGDLLSELPTRGITLPPRHGWAITLWPETRPGRDGPLVVSYRATISSAE